MLSKTPESADESKLSEVEKDGLKRLEVWRATGTAYALEHATKPSTIGFVLSSSPVALLAWYAATDLNDDFPQTDTLQDW